MNVTNLTDTIFFCPHSNEIILKDDCTALSPNTIFIYDLAKAQFPIDFDEHIESYIKILTTRDKYGVQPYPHYLTGILNATGIENFEIFRITTKKTTYQIGILNEGTLPSSIPPCPITPLKEIDTSKWKEEDTHEETVNSVCIDTDDELNEDREDDLIVGHDFEYQWNSKLKQGEFNNLIFFQSNTCDVEPTDIYFSYSTATPHESVLNYLGSIIHEISLQGGIPDFYHEFR